MGTGSTVNTREPRSGVSPGQTLRGPHLRRSQPCPRKTPKAGVAGSNWAVCVSGRRVDLSNITHRTSTSSHCPEVSPRRAGQPGIGGHARERSEAARCTTRALRPRAGGGSWGRRRTARRADAAAADVRARRGCPGPHPTSAGPPVRRAASSSVSSRGQELISRCFTRGGSTSDAMFRVMSSSRTAAVRAARSTRWASLAVAGRSEVALCMRVVKRRTSATPSDSSPLVPSRGTAPASTGATRRARRNGSASGCPDIRSRPSTMAVPPPRRPGKPVASHRSTGSAPRSRTPIVAAGVAMEVVGFVMLTTMPSPSLRGVGPGAELQGQTRVRHDELVDDAREFLRRFGSAAQSQGRFTLMAATRVVLRGAPTTAFGLVTPCPCRELGAHAGPTALLVGRTIRRADERISDICALTSRHLMTWRIAYASASTLGEDMRKPHKTAVVAVLLSAIGFLGTGTAYADGQGHGDGHKHGQKHEQKHGHKQGHKQGKGKKQEGKEGQSLLIAQSTSCTTVEENIDVQGQIGFQNGREGNRANGEGSPGSQATILGSRQGCNNTVVLGK
ncbi:hypothetical protein STVIR_5050 [Streptomyces viridochromogenes Tue57]|uniref:Uncharacterized protein n=2 Tax=Streptomyces viridochromogenes TaxID=1938 RepID=L8PF66_STRVR|nr:hypothetical protein STVIR_5050 [Streptomyces viridochromogenes Tue57]